MFYDQNFTSVQIWGMYNGLARATGVSESVLRTGDLSRSSVAQKMSRAATRKTTRIEDRAYSLMDLFGIQIPMLYGEGENALSRLQEEIIRTTPDDSIFAWRAAWGSASSYCGLLAKSPDVFEQSQSVDRGRSTFAMSNLGLKIEALLSPGYASEKRFRECRLPIPSTSLYWMQAKMGEQLVYLYENWNSASMLELHQTYSMTQMSQCWSARHYMSNICSEYQGSSRAVR